VQCGGFGFVGVWVLGVFGGGFLWVFCGWGGGFWGGGFFFFGFGGGGAKDEGCLPENFIRRRKKHGRTSG